MRTESSDEGMPLLTHVCENTLSICRLCSGVDRRDRLVAAQLQRRRQSSLLPDQDQLGLLHHIPEV